jgi:hypothetical protein
MHRNCVAARAIPMRLEVGESVGQDLEHLPGVVMRQPLDACSQ